MSTSSLNSVLFVLLLLIGLAQVLGALFVKMRQPKVIGEILAGVVLGPALLGRFHIVSSFTQAALHKSDVLEFIYWLGLLLLMFLSGAETQQRVFDHYDNDHLVLDEEYLATLCDAVSRH